MFKQFSFPRRRKVNGYEGYSMLGCVGIDNIHISEAPAASHWKAYRRNI